MKNVTYKQLTINEKINLKSGFDIAVAHESKMTRLMHCMTMTNINKNCCQKVYNIDKFYISARTKRY